MWVFPPKFRFIVRDFQYNEEEMKADKEEMNRLSTDKKKQFVRYMFKMYFLILKGLKRETETSHLLVHSLMATMAGVDSGQIQEPEA